MKSEETRERIIKETIILIKEMNGEIDKVTIRNIARKAQVGIGLINHYFGTKDYLINICVEKIIENVVQTFKIDNTSAKTPLEITKIAARQVIDFLMDNIQISTISILGDLSSPQVNDNSIQTAHGFAYCMSGGIHPEKYIKKAFFLLTILQESFLRKNVLYSNIGIDYFDKKQRDNYINGIVDMVMGEKE